MNRSKPNLPDTPQAIANAFHTATLDRLNSPIIPCDYFTLWLTLPLTFIAHILPLLAVIAIPLAYLLQPADLQAYYRNFLNSDHPTQALSLALIAIAYTIALGQFLPYRRQLRLDLRGLRESWREHRTKQQRYGLILTPDHFALRCFAIGYHQPLIIPRQNITTFYLCSEYSAASHERHRYIVMATIAPDGSEQRYRLPGATVDRSVRQLYTTLTDWLDTPEHEQEAEFLQ
jgi:hypothetical protein